MKLGLHENPNKRVELELYSLERFDLPSDSYDSTTLIRKLGVAEDEWRERFQFEKELDVQNGPSKWLKKLLSVENPKAPLWKVCVVMSIHCVHD